MKNIKNLKKTLYWKNFIKYIFKPIFDILWKNLINFHGRILYLIYFSLKKDREHLTMNGNDKKLICHPKIVNLASRIKNYFSEEDILNLKKKLVTNLSKDQNKANSEENRYKVSLLENLDIDLKKEILNFGMSELMVSTAAKYLKVFPILGKVALYLNIPTPENNKARGAMLWHKDDFGYKSLDLFVIITDVDETNGPLFSIDKKVDLGVFQRISQEKKNPIKGERGKIEDKTFSQFFTENNVIELSGKTGNALLIDSFTAYHKGGHCLKNHRIMLRYSYQTADAIRLPENKNNEFYYFKDLKKKEVKNIFNNFLLFKRSLILKILKIDVILLKIYRIIGYRL